MRALFLSIVIILLSACNSETEKKAGEIEINSRDISTEKITDKGKKHKAGDFQIFHPKEIELSPPDDSLWYQMSFILSDDTYLTVSQPSTETREGIRLQTLKKVNEELHLISSSSPGYDSPQLFPTFFRNGKNEVIILANTGTEQSWGIKVYSLIDGKFSDIGFIDMAKVVKREFPDDNGNMLQYSNISPYTVITNTKKGMRFDFRADKIILFEDLNNNHDVMIEPSEYSYIYMNNELKLIKN